ncbi:MAG TPA: biotin synthase BioB [Polyangiales bacterium]|nr:biotin synthase BioB [Polyangiales bacterium]
MQSVRHDWTVREVRALHDLPLIELVFRAQEVHKRHHESGAVQLCTLLSVKTGGCPEDCSYCPQSAHHETKVASEKLMSVDDVLAKARIAKDNGATRFCMGAAWRNPRGKDFDKVLQMVEGVRAMGLEACATLGMLDDSQADRLAQAGLTAYNHNLDTSRDHYKKIISTRTYDDRLDTLDRVARAGISTCCGGIIGMGESIDDRCALLCELAHMRPHPGSVPVNALVPVDGTPLDQQKVVDSFEMVRMIATARIMMPESMVRLSAGREGLSREAQLLCFMAGANSIFYGDKLLTTGNPDVEADRALFRDAGLKPIEARPEACEHRPVVAAE